MYINEIWGEIVFNVVAVFWNSDSKKKSVYLILLKNETQST